MSKSTIFKNKYLYLLISLISYFLIMAYLVDHKIQGAVHTLSFALVILFAVYSISHRKVILIIAVFLGLITFIENWYTALNANNALIIGGYVTSILFLSTITYTIIENLLGHKKVTIDTLLGAICGYILIGYIWTFFYILIAQLNPGAFLNTLKTTDDHQTLLQFVYYSFVSLTTVGYGDILATSSMARTLSWLEAIVGQAYLTIWIAQLVGLHIVSKKR